MSVEATILYHEFDFYLFIYFKIIATFLWENEWIALICHIKTIRPVDHALISGQIWSKYTFENASHARLFDLHILGQIEHYELRSILG